MKGYHQECGEEYQYTQPVEEHILVGPDYVGIVDDDSIGKSTFTAFLDLELIQGMHQSGVP